MKAVVILLTLVFVETCALLFVGHRFGSDSGARPNEVDRLIQREKEILAEIEDLKELSKLIDYYEPNKPNEASSYYVVDVNLFTFEPCTQISISCENGNDVIIDFSGDEVVVAGASEEGAKVFFEYVKDYMDAYLESKSVTL